MLSQGTLKYFSCLSRVVLKVLKKCQEIITNIFIDKNVSVKLSKGVPSEKNGLN